MLLATKNFLKLSHHPATGTLGQRHELAIVRVYEIRLSLFIVFNYFFVIFGTTYTSVEVHRPSGLGSSRQQGRSIEVWSNSDMVAALLLLKKKF
jgi:hypothetical protein